MNFSPSEETPRQLQALVAYPREDLDRELKGWLDLNEGEQVASLMKAVLALANHGGGFVLLGFTEQQGTWAEDVDGRPTDLTSYDQDRINGFVANYAEPVFHCEVHHVAPADRRGSSGRGCAAEPCPDTGEARRTGAQAGTDR